MKHLFFIILIFIINSCPCYSLAPSGVTDTPINIQTTHRVGHNQIRKLVEKGLDILHASNLSSLGVRCALPGRVKSFTYFNDDALCKRLRKKCDAIISRWHAKNNRLYITFIALNEPVKAYEYPWQWHTTRDGLNVLGIDRIFLYLLFTPDAFEASPLSARDLTSVIRAIDKSGFNKAPHKGKKYLQTELPGLYPRVHELIMQWRRIISDPCDYKSRFDINGVLYQNTYLANQANALLLTGLAEKLFEKSYQIYPLKRGRDKSDPQKKVARLAEYKHAKKLLQKAQEISSTENMTRSIARVEQKRQKLEDRMRFQLLPIAEKLELLGKRRLHNKTVLEASKILIVPSSTLQAHLDRYPEKFEQFGIINIDDDVIMHLLDQQKPGSLKGLTTKKVARLINIFPKRFGSFLKRNPEAFKKYGFVTMDNFIREKLASYGINRLKNHNKTEAAAMIGVDSIDLCNYFAEHPRELKRYRIKKGVRASHKALRAAL